jgi:hypothetical protein
MILIRSPGGIIMRHLPTLIAAIASTTFCSASFAAPPLGDGYEIWASDQSNSVPGIAAPGVAGGYVWIWDSEDLERQLAGGPDAQPLGCAPGKAPGNVGPCNVLDLFPADLEEIGADGQPTGLQRGDLAGFGRVHGMLPDPQNRYMNVNLFAPNGGYVGIIDTRSKAAVALFRVTGSSAGRSVHMSYWTHDGSALLVANLNGKLLERIDVERNPSGRIMAANFNRSATLSVGQGLSVTSGATAFRGHNARGQPLIGSVSGSYDDADLGDLTPQGKCKENGCAGGSDGAAGGRPNNLIICPLSTANDNVYVTLAAGGLLIADARATPMAIVGEYGNQVINGAGCGGALVDDEIWINAGVSASPAGETHSTYTLYAIDDSAVTYGAAENSPAPTVVYKDAGNTATNGNVGGLAPNVSGQIPGLSTRRDAHGLTATLDEAYVHSADRIQNTMDVFDTATLALTTYDLTSADGQGNGPGACGLRSVADDVGLPTNDPASDLMYPTPDGKYLLIALRGPVPVSVNHSSQGSCPGVGVIALTDNGASGYLVDVLRTTNTADTSSGGAPGGHPYQGAERSDVHGVSVVRKQR